MRLRMGFPAVEWSGHLTRASCLKQALCTPPRALRARHSWLRERALGTRWLHMGAG